MSAKVVLVFCTQTLFAQLTFGLCAGRTNLGAGLASYGLGASGYGSPVIPAPRCSGLGHNGIGNGNLGLGYGARCGSNLPIEVIPTSGGSLPVSSSSSLSPTGLSLVSDNIFEGNLYAVGDLPFASAVALEGVLPSGGAGAVSYSCGNGVTAIKSIGLGGAYGPGAGIGAYGAGLGVHGAASVAQGHGCHGNHAPVAEIVAPIDGCYPGGVYY